MKKQSGYISIPRRLLVFAGMASVCLNGTGTTPRLFAADLPAMPSANASTLSLPAAITDSTGAAPLEFSVVPVSGEPFLTNLIYTPSANYLRAIVQFNIAGGMSNQVYDILTTTNATSLSASNSTWTWLGQGYTSNTYVFYNQPGGASFYTLAPPRSSTVIAWGDDTYGQSDVPPGLSNVVAVAGGFNFSLALKSDGTLVAWGDNTEGETNIPPCLSNVVAIAAGPYHSLALRADGTVMNWGKWWVNQTVPLPMMLPASLTNVVGIAAGAEHDVALRADGTLVVWGYTNELYNTIPPGLGAAIAITAGWDHNVALSPDGTVTA